MADFHDINSPGAYRAKADEPQQTTQTATAVDEENPQQQSPAEPEIRFLSATFEPDKVHGYSLNKGCRVTGTAEFLKETTMTKVTLMLYAVYDGTEEDLQINQAKYGTANINKKDNTFTFSNVPLYNATGYPDRDGFKTPVTYKAVITATRAEKPLECILELPQQSAPELPLLQKDMYDDKATEKYPSKYRKGGKGYVEGTPIFDYQQVLEQLNYLPKGTANGVFGPKTDTATRAFQTDSTGKRRVNKSSGKLIDVEKITYTDVVDGIVGQNTRDELSVWQTKNYLRPLPNLYHGDFDKQAVQKGVKANPRSNNPDPVQKSEEENGDDYHDVGTPVLELQKMLVKIEAYKGLEDGFFADKTRVAVNDFQYYAEKGEFIINNKLTTIGETLNGHRTGVADTATQDFAKKVLDMGGKVPKGKYYGGYELKRGDSDKLKKWGGEIRKDEGLYVKDLQNDLKEIGITSVGTVDGGFGEITEKALIEFQKAALKTERKQKNKELKVPITYDGSNDGILSHATAKELTLWKDKEYRYNIPGILIYENTKFRYKKTKLTCDQCIATLPAALRKGFRDGIVQIIKKMHELGFSFGVLNSAKAGYRSFQDQYDIDPSKTKAGPGESFHNYGLAVDLGVLNWVDSDGKEYKNDFWLGQMDAKKIYKGFSTLLWEKRNSFNGSHVHALSWEIIHLQGIPAKSSGRTALVKCLNKAANDNGDLKWKYRTSAKTYESTLGTENTWTNIGTAKQMWSKTGTNCTKEQKNIISSHMKSAEKIALSINLE